MTLPRVKILIGVWVPNLRLVCKPIGCQGPPATGTKPLRKIDLLSYGTTALTNNGQMSPKGLQPPPWEALVTWIKGGWKIALAKFPTNYSVEMPALKGKGHCTAPPWDCGFCALVYWTLKVLYKLTKTPSVVKDGSSRCERGWWGELGGIKSAWELGAQQQRTGSREAVGSSTASEPRLQVP